MMMYIMMSVCIGVCTPDVPNPGGLVFTSLEDCQAEVKDMNRFSNANNGLVTFYKDGKKQRTITQKQYDKERGYRFEHQCVQTYFADYAQTERLTYGRVVCSYRTMILEDFMARRLDPYPDKYCHDKKAKP